MQSMARPQPVLGSSRATPLSTQWVRRTDEHDAFVDTVVLLRALLHQQTALVTTQRVQLRLLRVAQRLRQPFLHRSETLPAVSQGQALRASRVVRV